MRHYMRDVFSGLPDTVLDWGGCIIFLWLFSFWPSWQLRLAIYLCWHRRRFRSGDDPRVSRAASADSRSFTRSKLRGEAERSKAMFWLGYLMGVSMALSVVALAMVAKRQAA